jgi:hypothetical protein
MPGYPGEYGATLFESHVIRVSIIWTAGGDDGFTQSRL